MAFRAIRRLHRLHLLGDHRIEAARQRYGSSDYRAARGVMRQVLVRVLAERYDAQLAAINCPTILVWGDDDTTAPVSVAEEAATRLRRGELRRIDGGDHLLPRSAPESLRQAVLDNLGSP